MISIITVCFNSASTIQDTLESVRSQSYRNYEHIIVDGGSTDGTLEIIKSNMYPNLSVFFGPDDGIYDAMNKGIDLARGDIVGILNSDDCFSSPSILSKIVEVFNDSDIDCIYGNLTFVDRGTNTPLRKWISSKFIPGAFSGGWHPAHPTFYCRRKVYECVGAYNLDIPISSDFDFMLRVLEVYKFKSFYLEENLINMKNGGASNKNLINIFIGFKGIMKSFKINDIDYSIMDIILNRYINKLLSLIKGVIYK
jgi:glycosyltransferase involved in cell wall biosynthesis